MGQIQVLDIAVANLIAAGEVVDRPASVIKELMENAIDAKSTMITVEIKRGGVAFMRVTDNGCGMHREDVPVAIQRHATSKIRSARDLDSILTLGFRGEALAAIASVSTMRIMTKRKEEPEGTFLVARHGEVEEIGAANPADGTTIIIEELFYNVPARRKFLKSDMAEAMAVTAAVEKIALSHPEISIRFIVDNNLKFSSSGDGKLINTIYSVLGRDFSKRLFAVEHKTEGIAIEGYIGAPDHVKSNRNYENFFINGRYVKSRTAMAAVEQAFHSYMASEKFPCCVLNIHLHPAFVDVNVHPTKLEVKFSNEHMVFDAVYSAVRSTLMQNIDRPQLQLPNTVSSEDVRITQAFVPIYDKMNRDAPDEEILTQLKIEDLEKQSISSSAQENADKPTQTEKTETQVPMGFQPGEQVQVCKAPQNVPDPSNLTKTDLSFAVPNVMQDYDFDRLQSALSVSDPVTKEQKTPEQPQEKPKETETPTTKKEIRSARKRIPKENFKILGVAFHSYVFVEWEDKVLVIDKHAAHERILFENLKENIFLERPNAQILFLPMELELDAPSLAAASDYQNELQRMGFAYQILPQLSRVNVTEIPLSLSQEQARELMSELLSKLAQGTGNAAVSKQILYEKVLYQASCKAAVKAGRQDDMAHVEWICSELLSLPDIKFCPHGRPVAFELSRRDLEHQFKRT